MADRFLVLHAASRPVDFALQLMLTKRASWLVIRYGGAYYVVFKRELAELHRKSPSLSLDELLQRHPIEPSVVLESARAVVDAGERSGSRQSRPRAVVLAKGSGADRPVRAIGNLRRAADARRGKPGSKLSGLKLHPISFGGSARKSKTPSIPPRSYTVVDVLYATDREPAPSSGLKMMRYKNRLAAKPHLDYGVCSVTVPKSHEPGKLESPSYWHFEFRESPDKHFTIVGCAPRTAEGFFGDLSRRVSQSQEKSCFVFIHGFNVSFEDAAKCAAQLATDVKFAGVPVLYSWASANETELYDKDAETIGMTQKSFEKFLADVARASAATNIHLIAHSMGNRALIEALERFASTEATKLFDQVVLAAADVPAHNIDSRIAAARVKSKRLTLYASRRDSALWLSSVKNAYPRLGRIYEPPSAFQGLDTVDVSKFKGDFWNHSAFLRCREVVNDLKAVLAGEPPEKRFGLQAAAVGSGAYWILK